MEIKTIAHIFLIVSLFSGSSTPVLLALVTRVNLFEFFFVASAAGVCSSMALLIMRGKVHKFRLFSKNRRKIVSAAIAGVLSFFPIEYGIEFSEHYITPALTTAIFRTSPLLMLGPLPTLLRERLTKYQIIALSLGFFGLYIGVTGGNLISISQAEFGAVVFMIVMAFVYALSSVMVKKDVFNLEVFFVVANLAFFFFAGIAFIAAGIPLAPLKMGDVVLAVYIGAFLNVYSFYMYFYSFRILRTTLVTNTYLFAPFITFVYLAIVFEAAIKPYYLLIAGAVGVGMVIQQLDKRGGSYLPTGKYPQVRNMTISDVTAIFESSKINSVALAIERGEKVLATKFNTKSKPLVDGLLNSIKPKNVFLSAQESGAREVAFIRYRLKAGKSDIILYKAGPPEEVEELFANIEDSISKEAAPAAR